MAARNEAIPAERDPWLAGILARYVAPKAFSHVLEIYKLPDEVQQRPALFGVMATLLNALRECPVQEPARPFIAYREEVLSITISNLRNRSTRPQALECLVQLVQVPQCLAPDEIVFALQSITDLLTTSTLDGNEEVGPIALGGLTKLAPLLPKQTENVVLPPLFHLLPDVAPAKQDHRSNDSYRLGLAALASLCILPQLFETFLIRSLSRLDSVCSHSSRMDGRVQYSQSVLYAHHILTALRIVLEKKVKAVHTDLHTHIEKILASLYKLFIIPSVQQKEHKTITAEPKLVEDAGKIMTILVQQMDLVAQMKLATELKVAYFDGHLGGLLDLHKMQTEKPFSPFKVRAPSSLNIGQDLFCDSQKRLSSRRTSLFYMHIPFSPSERRYVNSFESKDFLYNTAFLLPGLRFSGLLNANL